MRNAFRTIQFLGNIATIVIAVLLSALTVKYVVLSQPLPRIPATIAPRASSSGQASPQATPVSQIVPLQNIDWTKSDKTLILYISSTCKFCSASGPFYQKLVNDEAAKGIHFVAVMPQSVNEGHQYLNKLGVRIDDVYEASLETIGVRATPTLLLVNKSGVVTDSWVGQLQPDREDQVISKLEL